MNKKYRVTLSADERDQLHSLLTSGRLHVRTMKRAQVLLKADDSAAGPAWELVVPDARNRLEPLLDQLLPEGESTIIFSSFMEQLAERCPELDGGSLFRRCMQVSRPDQLGNRLSLMLSNALRVLHEADKIHLSLQPDATTKWMLYPAVGHSLGLVSHIQCGRAA